MKKNSLRWSPVESKSYYELPWLAKKEIVTLYPTGLAFKNYGTVEFFWEMLIRVSPTFEEIRKRLLQEHHEYLGKRHREELRPEEPCRKEGYWGKEYFWEFKNHDFKSWILWKPEISRKNARSSDELKKMSGIGWKRTGQIIWDTRPASQMELG